MATGVSIAHCYESGARRQFTTRVHCHPFWEVFCFADGRAEVTTNERTFPVSMHDVILYPPETDHQVQWSGEVDSRYFSLGLFLTDFPVEDTLHLRDYSGTMRWLVEHIHREWQAKPRDDALLAHYVGALLRLIERQAGEDPAQADRFALVLQYIHAHYAESPSLETLAQLMPVSKSYLSRAFRRRTGQTAMQYIHQVRIQAARQLLSSSELGVEAVSEMVGYASAKHFSRMFRALQGQSPREYRKSPVHF